MKVQPYVDILEAQQEAQKPEGKHKDTSDSIEEYAVEEPENPTEDKRSSFVKVPSQ